MHDTLIFDFDGTLIDSAPGILATYAAVLNAAGIQPVVALDARLVGPPLLPTMSKLTGPLDPEKLDALVEEFKRRYVDIGVANTPAYAGADAALQRLRASGKTLYLATNKRAEPTLMLLEKFGWASHFHRVYCIDSHQPAFADKTAMLRQLLSENSLDPRQALYIGDTRGDYLSASACGISFVAALWGYGDWQTYPNLARLFHHSYASPTDLANGLALPPPA